MSEEFTSSIVKEFKENKGTVVRGDTTFRLAEYYGFCWGVERAVAMAFQARKHFPDQVHTIPYVAQGTFTGPPGRDPVDDFFLLDSVAAVVDKKKKSVGAVLYRVRSLESSSSSSRRV